MSDLFRAFPKITRTTKPIIVTEKIDGTNACVIVTEQGEVFAQSRTRIVTPEDDNYGFAAWVQQHAAELQEGLGVGYHFGEWWGKGINRGYGLDEKRFSLFNVGRWGPGGKQTSPACCHVVPVLCEIESGINYVDLPVLAEALRTCGSVAAPGFMRPEGFMLWFENGMYLKHVIDKPEAAHR